ncbi:metalloendoproteinase 1-MMP-like [Rutidosis leptorrhynchoides]|uniref:metalloendoproteinase 1-MMP-like n=1 Tax=Rutidosis leptorrhynchoides TaxID=125765 RepID=UPI003A992DD7
MHMIFLFNIFVIVFLLQCVFHANTTVTPISPLNHNHNVNATWHKFSELVVARKGAKLSGLSELKKYFHRLGYLNDNFTDTFDDTLETAVLNYQKKLGLPITGTLDSNTVTEIMTPRCGVSDKTIDNLGSKYTIFSDFDYPKWDNQTEITYAFSTKDMINYLSFDDIQDVLRRSFSRWASVTPLKFKEVDDYGNADIKIGFYEGDHGDGQPFDGVLGFLAHAFPRALHFDDAETWVNIDYKSKVGVDLESIATHEIGHVLGLGHSSVEKAIMYPNFKRGVKKADLNIDDVEGIQKIYGPNPNKAFVESDSSSYGPEGGRSVVKWNNKSLLKNGKRNPNKNPFLDECQKKQVSKVDKD